jgi:uncharacterized protein (DUF433 family)
MSAAATQWKYLERNPRSSYLQLSVKGTKIHARTLYGQYMRAEDPMTVEEIAADWNLPIEAVREAIAYCQSKPPEIDEDFRVEEAMMEASGMNHPQYKSDPKKYYRAVPPEEKARIVREIRGE